MARYFVQPGLNVGQTKIVESSSIWNDEDFFGKALQIGALVAKFALKLLKKNTDDLNQLRKLGLNLLVQDVQEQHFDEEMKAIRNGQDISGTSNLLQLYLFIDDDGLLKVGG